MEGYFRHRGAPLKIKCLASVDYQGDRSGMDETSFFPLMVKVSMPTGVFGFVVIVKVWCSEPVIQVGTNEELARAGNPLTRKISEQKRS